MEFARLLFGFEKMDFGRGWKNVEPSFALTSFEVEDRLEKPNRKLTLGTYLNQTLSTF